MTKRDSVTPFFYRQLSVGLVMDINGKNKVISLLRQQPRSRVELAKCTGLVKSSLTKITQQLLQDGLIEELTGDKSGEPERHGGRPETRLQLRPGVHHSLCFYISIEGIICFLIDQTSAVIERYQIAWDRSGTGDALTTAELVAQIVQITEHLCAKNAVEPYSLKLISVATQGKLAQATGEVHYSQLLTERHVHLTQAITAATGIAAKLYNIAYCSSFRLHQLYPQHPSFIAILLGYGMGVGIAIDNRIVLGPDGTAPEISHITYAEDGPQCYCGAKGCAETYLTYNAILTEVSRLRTIPWGSDQVLAQLDEVNELLNQRDPVCERVIRQAGRVLGHVLAQLVTLLDIRIIILNGEVSLFFSVLKEEIEAYLLQHGDYRFGDGGITILRELDNQLAFAGLIELTNEGYAV